MGDTLIFPILKARLILKTIGTFQWGAIYFFEVMKLNYLNEFIPKRK
jgi:hypothetical protein